MCTVLLPPGVNPTAVNKYIKYQNVDTKRYILLEIDFSLVFFIFISNGDFYSSVCVCVCVCVYKRFVPKVRVLIFLCTNW
jgi:hypothetical protein